MRLTNPMLSDQKKKKKMFLCSSGYLTTRLVDLFIRNLDCTLRRTQGTNAANQSQIRTGNPKSFESVKSTKFAFINNLFDG